jgi:MarR family transcriptional regulator for hemolysin
MPAPVTAPIGLRLANTTRAVNRAFDEALSAVGGSRSSWLILLALTRGPDSNQRELAEAVGVGEATITHHLNAMEVAGLVTRSRDPANHRVHVLELTDRGHSAFLEMRDQAIAFDRRLRRGLIDADLAHLEQLLDRLRDNALAVADRNPPRVTGPG